MTTIDDVIAALKTADEAETDPDKPLLAWGFDQAKQGGVLNRETLDAISTDRPIYVVSWAPHFAYLNSAALEATGLKPDTDIHGVYKNDDGSLSGVFNENVALQAALRPVLPTIIKLGGVGGLYFMADIAQKTGVTTVAELTYGVVDFDTEWKDTLKATSDPEFPVRMHLVADGQTMKAKFANGGLGDYAAFLERNTDKAYVDGVKFFTDGSVPLMSSLVNYPGFLDGTNGSINAIPWDKLTDSVFPWWDAGIQIHMHANGDMALDQALDTLEQFQQAKPRFDHRYTIEHFSMSNSMQPRRIKELGAIVSLEPGKFADFTILESDPFTVDPGKLKDVPVWGTALSGKVFQSNR